MISLDDVLFSCECDEPRGKVIRSVRQLEFSKENLIKLYEKVSKFKTFLGKEVNSIEDMANVFLTPDVEPKGICLVIDEFIGIFWLTDINGLFDASVHYTFFDRRQRGRVSLCKEALRWCFNTFQFHRLSTCVPEYEIKVSRFVEMIGFTQTGIHRKNRIIGDRVYNTLLYDLLKEEMNGLS